MTSDRVYRWRLVLEEYGPEIIYIKGKTNIVADTLSRIQYNRDINTRDINVHAKSIYMIKLMNHYIEKTTKSGEDSLSYMDKNALKARRNRLRRLQLSFNAIHVSLTDVMMSRM